MGSRSARTGGSWPRGGPTRPSESGTSPPPGRSPACGATRRRSTGSPSAPTARGWRRLVPEGRSRADVLGRIRANTTIGEAVRREALGYARTVWAARVRQRTFRRVQALFAKPRGASEVRELLRRDGALNEEERQAAL